MLLCLGYKRDKTVLSRKNILSFIILVFCLLLSGCTFAGIETLEEISRTAGVTSESDRIEIQDSEEAVGTVMEGSNKIVRIAGKEISPELLKACLILRGWAPLIVVLSILFGYSLTEIFPKNAEIRKFGIVSMGIRIPVTTIIITYLLAVLYGVVAGEDIIRTEAASIPGKICIIWYEFSKRISGWVIFGCAASIAFGIFLSEKYRTNLDVVRMSKRYFCYRVPMIAFLTFVAYPVLFGLFA